MTRLLPIVAASIIAANPAATAADIVTLAGKRSLGTLVEVTTQVVTVKDTAGGLVRVPTPEMASIEFGKPSAPPVGKFDEVELTDGSVLRVSQFRIKGRSVEVTPVGSGPLLTIDLPLSAVFTLVRGADDPATRAAFAKVVASRGKRDLFVVKQAGGLNLLPGTVLAGTPTGDAVEFEKDDGQRTTLRLNRASGGLVFNPPPAGVVPPAIARVTDRAGAVLVAETVAVSGDGLRVTTVAGAVVTYPSLDGVVAIDFRRGNVAYLVDLPVAYDYPPPEADGPLGEAFPTAPRAGLNRAVNRALLELDGRKYAAGVAVPVDAAAAYRLDGGYREFRAVVGLPDGPGRVDWAVRLRIDVDGKPAFDAIIKKGDKPREVNLSVKDAKELRVAADRTGLFLGDQVILADARVQK